MSKSGVSVGGAESGAYRIAMRLDATLGHRKTSAVLSCSRAALLVTTVLAGSVSAAKADAVYTGLNNSSWNSPLNWNLDGVLHGGVPTSTTPVRFGASDVTTLLSASGYAQTLLTNGSNTGDNIDLGGQTLYLWSAPAVSATFDGGVTSTSGAGTLNFGYAGSTGSQEIDGLVTQSGSGSTGIAVDGGSLTLGATTGTANNTFGGGLTVNNGGVFNANGAYTLGSGAVTVNNSGTVTSALSQSVQSITTGTSGHFSFDGGNVSSHFTVGAGGIANNGTFSFTGFTYTGGIPSVPGVFNAIPFDISGGITNTGTFTLNGGANSYINSQVGSKGITNTGTMTLNNSPTPENDGTLAAGMLLETTGVLNNSGVLTLNGVATPANSGTIVGLKAGSINNSGTVTLIGGTNNNALAIAVEATAGGIDNSGTVYLNGGSSGVWFSATGPIVNSGTIHFSGKGGTFGGSVSGSAPSGGPLTNTASGTLDIANSFWYQTIGNLAENDGAINVASGAWTNVYGSPTNGIVNKGSIRIDGNASFYTQLAGTANSSVTVGPGGILSIRNSYGENSTFGTLTLDSGSSLTLMQTLSTGKTASGGAATVFTDFVNANAGSGNAYNPASGLYASVINAAGTGTLQTIVGANGSTVTGGGTSTPVLNVGNIHVADTTGTVVNPGNFTSTGSFQILNSGTGTPVLRGAVQTTGLSDSRLGGLTAGNFSAAQNGGASGIYTVTFGNATTAGALSGQTIGVVSTYTNIPTQQIAVQGAVYNFAQAAVVNDVTDLGPFHVGVGASGNVSVANIAPNDGYSEGLDLTSAKASGTGWSATVGTTSTIASGASGTVSASLANGQVGVNTGTVTISSQSDGAGTSGLGTTRLTDKTATVTAVGYQYASPALAQLPGEAGTLTGTSASGYVLDFGAVASGSTVSSIFNVLNVLQPNDPTGHYTDWLEGAFKVVSGSGFDVNLAAITSMAPGSSEAPGSVSFSAVQGGAFTEVIEFDPLSNNTAGLGQTALSPIYLTLAASSGHSDCYGDNIDNFGICNIYGDVTNHGFFINEPVTPQSQLNIMSKTYFVNGPLTNSGVVTVLGGATLDVTDNQIRNLAVGTIDVKANGSLHGDMDNAGTVINNGDAHSNVKSNTGTITNLGNWTGDVNAGANIGTGAIINAGMWTGTGNNDGGTIANSGTWAGQILNNSGTFTNTGSVTGGLTNSGAVNAAGVIDGAIQNNGAGGFVVTGPLVANGTVSNSGAATLAVTGGDFTGVTTLTNTSTAASGISIASGRTLNAATVNNAAGATITNAGSLIAGTVNNAAGATLTTTGVVTTTAGLNNGGVVNASGIVNGAIGNSGTFTVTGALAGDGTSTFANASTGALAVGANSFGTIAAMNTSGLVAIGTGSLSAGTIAQSGGTITNAGGLNGAATISVTGGTLINHAAGTVTTPILTIGPNGTLATSGVIVASTSIANAGTVTAHGAWTTPDIENNGQFTLTGALTGAVAAFNNNAGGTLAVGGSTFGDIGTLASAGAVMIGTGGALTADVVSQTAGTIANAGSLTGTTSIGIGAGATLTTTGVVSTTQLVNSGTVNANGGSVNGAIDNKSGGLFAVGGVVNGPGSFLNAAGAQVEVSPTGNYRSGSLTNVGSVNVAKGGVWAGTTVGYNIGGAINNAGSWSGGLVNAGGVITNSGGIAGGVTNAAGYTNNIGTISGGVKATGGLVDSFTKSSVIDGGVSVSGSGAVYALNTIGGNVGVSPNGLFYVGDHSAVTPTSALGQTLRVSGSVTGGITIPVNLATGASNVINVGGSTSGASANLAGQLQNRGNLIWTVPNQTLIYANAPIPLTGASRQNLYEMSSLPYSLFNYTPTTNDRGILQSLKLGVSAPARQIGSIVTSLDMSFFDASQLVEPPNPTPNLLYGGVWSLGAGGGVTTESTASGGGSPTSLTSRSTNHIGGYQFGIDEGVYNINNSKMNVRVGLTAGQAFGGASTQFPGDAYGAGVNISSSANIPFYGVYAALTGKGLAAVVQWRHNNFGLSLNDPYLGGNNRRTLSASGNTFSADVGYTIPVGEGYTLTPSTAVFVSRTSINSIDTMPTVAGAPWSTFSFGPLNSTLGRVGARLEKPFQINDNLILSPYLSVNVWHEFQGGSTTYLRQLGRTMAPVTTTGVGTFEQVSLGFSTESPKARLSTYLRADLQTGQNLKGWGVVGGLRYAF